MTQLPTTQLEPPGDRIELSIGQPDPALLPEPLFRSMNSDLLSLAYGAEVGDGRFRETLAIWLSQQYGVAVAPESLMVTNGSSNALDMICTRLTRPGDTVLVEDPTYFIARRQLADHGLTTVAVPMDEHGVDVSALEKLILTHKPAFFYTVPTFHNPTGRTLSAERRATVVDLGKRFSCPIVADEVYQLLHYGNRPPAPLACFDALAPVLSIGSFSKILAPGLRLGWMQSSGDLLTKMEESALLASGGGLAPFTSSLVRPLIENGSLDRHLAHLKQVYRQRLSALTEGLQQQLAGYVDFTAPSGGYFVWAKWRSEPDAKALLPKALEAGVGFLPGNRFSDSAEQARAMRLCFAFYDAEQLRDACRRLRRLV